MIEARNLSKSFNSNRALQDLSVEIPAGEIFCFLGANGAGKTTLINLFLGFLEPTEGTALIDGTDVQVDPVTVRENVAYIPEKVALYPDLTGYENLEFFAKLAGRDMPESELLNCMERAGLPSEAVHDPTSSYSKGMQQKVGIACAIARSAKVLLLDEPLSGLDPKAANEFCALIAGQRSQGVATLMATHDLFRAREVGDRIGIMKSGRLVDVIRAESVTGQQLETLYLDHMHDSIEEEAA